MPLHLPAKPFRETPMTDIDVLGFGIFLIGVVAFVTIRAIIETMGKGE